MLKYFKECLYAKVFLQQNSFILIKCFHNKMLKQEFDLLLDYGIEWQQPQNTLYIYFCVIGLCLDIKLPVFYVFLSTIQIL